MAIIRVVYYINAKLEAHLYRQAVQTLRGVEVPSHHQGMHAHYGRIGPDAALRWYSDIQYCTFLDSTYATFDRGGML